MFTKIFIIDFKYALYTSSSKHAIFALQSVEKRTTNKHRYMVFTQISIQHRALPAPFHSINAITYWTISRVTLYTAGHLHTAVPHCSHSRAPIVHTAVPRENNEHGCVYLRCRAVCKLPGCVEGHPWIYLLQRDSWLPLINRAFVE